MHFHRNVRIVWGKMSSVGKYDPYPLSLIHICVIAPGIRTSAQALWGEADMLPAIEIRKPASILAKETISSMQGGLLYGQIGQTEYIVKRLKEESGYTDAKVVATGGLGKMIVSCLLYTSRCV